MLRAKKKTHREQGSGGLAVGHLSYCINID
jgi:hypothetical protein|nr:MAG TPA: hypothetical protein [Caudoviricetes sp.]